MSLLPPPIPSSQPAEPPNRPRRPWGTDRKVSNAREIPAPASPIAEKIEVRQITAPSKEPGESKVDVAKPHIVRCEMLAGKRVPDRQWLVQDWIPWGVVTGLYGDGGMGKSLLAQQLMTAAAVRAQWVGLGAMHLKSLGIFCEDDEDELHRRQADINQLLGVDFSDLSGMTWMPRFGEDNIFVTFTSRGKAELTSFYGRVEEAAVDLGAKFVAVDTASDTFGGSENDRGQVRYYVSAVLGKLARRIEGTVMVCAHPSRSGLASGEGDGGSTGWNNAFRSRLFLHGQQSEGDAAPDQNARVLSRKKANYAARNDEIRLRWRDGVLIEDRPGGAASISMTRATAEQVFLDILDRLTAQQRPVSSSRNSGNYAPKLFAGQPDRDGYNRADFERALQSLFHRNKITIADYGRKSDARQKIVRISEAKEAAE